MTVPAPVAPETKALVPSAVDPEIAQAIAIFDRLAPLKQALGLEDLTDPELQLFAMVAFHTGLDPFTRQIYAIKRKGKVTHQTGIDGYRSSAERTHQYAGSDEAIFEACDCKAAPEGHPKVARVVVHRVLPNGHVVDQVGVARWHELYPGPGDDGFMWRKMMFNQLGKCAEAMGLRIAFPRVLGGVYIAEEMQQADAEAATKAEAQRVANLPTAGDRLAARRAALEAQTADTVDGEATEVPGAPAIPAQAGGPEPEMTWPQFRERMAARQLTTGKVKAAAEPLFGDRVSMTTPSAWELEPVEWARLAAALGI